MILTELFKIKQIKFHILTLTVSLGASLVYYAYIFTLAREPLEIIQLISTLIITIHWWWGASFYFYYFYLPTEKYFFILDMLIIIFLVLAMINYKIYFLWALFMVLSYLVAYIMYQKKPNSPNYDERVKRFAKRKALLDLIVLFLFLTGVILGIVNKLFLRWAFIDAFEIVTTFIIIILSHIYIFATHFYRLR